MWQLRCLGPGEPRAWGGKGGSALPPPPLDGPQKLPAQFLTNFLPNHIM